MDQQLTKQWKISNLFRKRTRIDADLTQIYADRKSAVAKRRFFVNLFFTATIRF